MVDIRILQIRIRFFVLNLSRIQFIANLVIEIKYI